MSRALSRYLGRLHDVAPTLLETGAVLSLEAAAHAHLAAATGTSPGGEPQYLALVPRGVTILWPEGTDTRSRALAGTEEDRTPVGEVVRQQLGLFTRRVTWPDGTVLPVLSLEAVLAGLLGQGGLAIGLAGSLLRLVPRPALDVDGVREILKAARQPERFQPLLELLDVA